jgi:hypothetical protein
MTAPAQGFVHDERGSRSSARLLLYITTAAILGCIAATSLWRVAVPGEAWAILTAMETMFTVWAAGPRMAQYLSPLAQTAVSKMADVIRARRDPKDGIEPAP